MSLILGISKAVIRTSGPDKVILHVNNGGRNLPEATYPYKGDLTLDFTAGKGLGKNFCMEILRLEEHQIEIVGN